LGVLRLLLGLQQGDQEYSGYRWGRSPHKKIVHPADLRVRARKDMQFKEIRPDGGHFNKETLAAVVARSSLRRTADPGWKDRAGTRYALQTPGDRLAGSLPPPAF
jgi:hypothetical protein